MESVYITEISKFLPNAPVDNEEMEKILGEIGGKPSKAKKIVLRNNGIKNRYYAFREGKATHTNAQMVAEAVKQLFKNRNSLNQMQLLACGTTSADQLIPSHAAMVHGELGIRPVEIVSTTSACNAGIQALKYASMSIMTGNCHMAVSTGSDRLSVYMKREMFEAEADKLIALNENGWKLINAKEEYNDVISSQQPLIEPCVESIVWQCAEQIEEISKTLRYPGEDEEYEKEPLEKYIEEYELRMKIK